MMSAYTINYFVVCKQHAIRKQLQRNTEIYTEATSKKLCNSIMWFHASHILTFF